MINKQFEKIELADIHNLINNAVQESKTIEYKETFPGSSDSERKEFLADISSFSNTLGGDLLYGVTSEKGTPIKADGIKVVDVDGETLKYESIIRDGIDPRISISVRSLEVKDHRFIFIFRMSKSWSGPHRVVFKGHDKFYARNSAGKYSLDVAELRIAFNASQTLIDKINNFKTDRIFQLSANTTPIPFSRGAKIALHLIPYESFTPGYSIDVTEVKSNKLPPIMCMGWSYRINLEGIVTYFGKPNKESNTYTQLYRNGIIEAVCGGILEPIQGKYIPSVYYEKKLIESLQIYMRLLKELNIATPIVIFITFIDIKDYKFTVNTNKFWDNDYTMDRDILQLPETIIDSYDTDAIQILRPMFDLVWNAFGHERSYNFDEQGKWIAD